MKNFNLDTVDLICHVFPEYDAEIFALIAHPVYTLQINKPGSISILIENSCTRSEVYSRQMFEKLVLLEMYDLGPLISYNVDNVLDRRYWYDSLMFLLVDNHSLYVKHCSEGKYIYLFTLIVRLNSPFITDIGVASHEKCVACIYQTQKKISHNLKNSHKLPLSERKLLLLLINKEASVFDHAILMAMGKSILSDIKNEIEMCDFEIQQQEEALVKQRVGDNNDSIVNGKVTIYCSALYFGKNVGNYVKNCKNEKKEYVFDYDIARLAAFIASHFYFVKNKNVSAKTIEAYLPPKRILKVN
jgi:hypothetical protein